MNLSLWIDDEEGRIDEENKKKATASKVKESSKCACGRAVCCGRHKKGQCSCQNQKQRS